MRENARKRVSTENYQKNATKIAKVEPEDSHFGQDKRSSPCNLSEITASTEQERYLIYFN